MPREESGLDAARLLLRGVVGATMIAHGVKHGRSLDGTARWFESIGFREPRLQAQASAGVEIASGAALVTGTATPLAAAAVIGTMGVAAATVHQLNGFFITAEGYEYVLNLSAAAAALAALGAGRFSVDRAFGVDRAGGRGASFALGLGGLGALGHLRLFWTRPVG